MKDFLSLTPKQCADVYPKIIENGNRHIQSAKLLGNHEEYPNAIAHLILGAEELIKGIFLALESKGIIYRQIKNYKKIFFDHKSRHNILKDFYSVWIPIKKIEELFINTKKGNSLTKGINLIIGGLNAYTNYKWWEKADSLKQRCFYVDFQDIVLLPSELHKSDFEQALFHIKSLHKDVNDLINFLESANQDTLDDFRETLNSEDSKELLQLVLEKNKAKS